MKTKFISKPLLFASLTITLLSAPAYADDSGGKGISGFFHHLFSHFSQANDADSDETSATQALAATPSATPSATPPPTPIPSPTAEPSAAPTAAPAIAPLMRMPVPVVIPGVIPRTIPTPVATPSVDACAEMSPGDARVVNYNTLPSEAQHTGVIPEYLLKRVGDNADGTQAYEAVLNIHFLPKAGENLDTDAMMKFTQNCYAALPPIVNTDGTTLKIRMADADEVAPVRNINLTGKPMVREDMVDWSTLSNCRVITHESLHLLGLVDLYKEPLLKTATGSLAYDCRKVGPADSVMRDYIQAHFSNNLYMSNSCSCDHSSCLKEISAIKETPTACPALADSSSFPLHLNEYDIATDPSSAKFFDENYKPYLETGKLSDWIYTYYSLQPDHHAFLYPAEFRMITAPGCHEKNSVYLQCASEAYRSSSNVNGCGDPTPSVCDDPNQWLQ
jgi:hypothetical protein